MGAECHGLKGTRLGVDETWIRGDEFRWET